MGGAGRGMAAGSGRSLCDLEDGTPGRPDPPRDHEEGYAQNILKKEVKREVSYLFSDDDKSTGVQFIFFAERMENVGSGQEMANL